MTINPQTYWRERLPDIIFVGGKKRSGKDYVCDRLVGEAGFHKCHIVEAWLRQWFAAKGLDPNQWETLKAQYRSEIQADAKVAREADPDCLIKSFRQLLPQFPRPFCVTAVRFVNEARLGMQLGAMVIRVKTDDELRAGRFRAAGEDLALLDDPFESEVDLMPVHVEMSGTISGAYIVPTIAQVYKTLSLYVGSDRPEVSIGRH